MPRFTPKIGIVFKKIFGIEENKDLLISFINSILGAEDQVSDVTLPNPYNPKNFGNDSLITLAIKATNRAGKRLNIEIQILHEADYDKTDLYHWAKEYKEQLQGGDDYSTLSKAIGIHILNITSVFENKEYHNVFHITEQETGLLDFKDLELHTIELNKFSSNYAEKLADIVRRVKNPLDMWLAFLTRNDLLTLDNLPRELDDINLKKAINVLSVVNFTPEEREAYENNLKFLLIKINTLKKYKAKGIAEGIAEGIEEGRKEGIQIAEAGGKSEENIRVKIEIAKNLLSKNYPISDICDTTGLSPEEISKLQKLCSIGLTHFEFKKCSILLNAVFFNNTIV
jgi:predicted transposase/invertase (TIGR01784 family)